MNTEEMIAHIKRRSAELLAMATDAAVLIDLIQRDDAKNESQKDTACQDHQA